MRPFAIVVLLLFASTPVSADHIGIYDDTSGGPCFGPPPAPFAPFTMYILHENSLGAIAGRWRVIDTSGQLLPLSAFCGGLNVQGDPNGMIASYGSCLTSPITACTLTFLHLGGPLTGCNHLRVVPYLGDTEVQVMDCAEQQHDATAGYFSFNITDECDTCVLAVESTTWGKVKALYR